MRSRLLPSAGGQSAPLPRWARAFTLVEMLVVMAVIIIIISLVAPVLTGLKNAGDVSKTVYDMAGLLEQSRAYAMTNNTYVYVGFGEADANSSPAGKQTFSNNTIGRVSVAVVASKDGTPGYDANASSVSTSWNQAYALGKNFLTIGKAQSFTNIHIVDLGTPPATGNMARPPYGGTTAIDSHYNLGTTDCQSVTPFYYPLGTDASSANNVYAFTKVIQFDPQGTARIRTDNNTDSIPKQIEIGLQPARGGAAAPVTSGNVAAIQIDGMSGTTHIYRP